MIDRFVVSKSRDIRIPCDGPVTANMHRSKLELALLAEGYKLEELDFEIERVKPPRPRAHGESRRRPGHK